jgi:orotate phosphoribosyltransferase
MADKSPGAVVEGQTARSSSWSKASQDSQDETDALQKIAESLGALKHGEFTLSSGKNSPYYFDGRLLTLDPRGAFLIGQAFLPVVREAGAQAVGGLALGADPMATAIALTSHSDETPIPAFIVRKEPKDHGTGRAIEGHLPKGSKVAVVDDTCTSGESLLKAIAAVEDAGCKVVIVATILDRREGGSDEIRNRGYLFWTLLEATPEGKVMPAVQPSA